LFNFLFYSSILSHPRAQAPPEKYYYSYFMYFIVINYYLMLDNFSILKLTKFDAANPELQD